MKVCGGVLNQKHRKRMDARAYPNLRTDRRLEARTDDNDDDDDADINGDDLLMTTMMMMWKKMLMMI